MKSLAKKLARAVLGDYSIYDVYARSPSANAQAGFAASNDVVVRPVDEPALRAQNDPSLREQSGYAGAGSLAYAAYVGDRMLGVCFYWFGDRYRTRNFWPLQADEAKLVQIWVHPDARGRGVATRLIAKSFEAVVEHGFRRSYARIWHSNTPSLKAFERAGWTRIARVVEVNPLRRKRPFRLEMGS